MIIQKHETIGIRIFTKCNYYGFIILGQDFSIHSINLDKYISEEEAVNGDLYEYAEGKCTVFRINYTSNLIYEMWSTEIGYFRLPLTNKYPVSDW